MNWYNWLWCHLKGGDFYKSCFFQFYCDYSMDNFDQNSICSHTWKTVSWERPSTPEILASWKKSEREKVGKSETIFNKIKEALTFFTIIFCNLCLTVSEFLELAKFTFLWLEKLKFEQDWKSSECLRCIKSGSHLTYPFHQRRCEACCHEGEGGNRFKMANQCNNFSSKKEKKKKP